MLCSYNRSAHTHVSTIDSLTCGIIKSSFTYNRFSELTPRSSLNSCASSCFTSSKYFAIVVFFGILIQNERKRLIMKYLYELLSLGDDQIHSNNCMLRSRFHLRTRVTEPFSKPYFQITFNPILFLFPFLLKFLSLEFFLELSLFIWKEARFNKWIFSHQSLLSSFLYSHFWLFIFIHIFF